MLQIRIHVFREIIPRCQRTLPNFNLHQELQKPHEAPSILQYRLHFMLQLQTRGYFSALKSTDARPSLVVITNLHGLGAPRLLHGVCDCNGTTALDKAETHLVNSTDTLTASCHYESTAQAEQWCRPYG